MTEFVDQLAALLSDRYRIDREYGAGGMATVFLAHDLRHDREVAIKVLRPEIAAAVGAERFLAEIRITARLDHPHILTLIDSGSAEGYLYYVLPFVRGESLRARLDRQTQLGLDEALGIARQVASALEFAHAHGVIHRDVKPENILLHEGEAMLTDFGIALAVSEAAGARLTGTGLSLGTPQYMSPEQAMGERDLTPASDVFSLGAVLYEMLAGEAPHTGPTAQAVVAKLLTETPIPLRHIRATVPASIEAAVARALEKTPADRFGSAADLAAALEPDRHVSPAGSPGRRGWMYAAAAVLVVAGVLGYLHFRGSNTPLMVGRSSQLTADPGLEIQPDISPDGKLVAYAAGTPVRMRIYLRPVSGGRTIPLSDDSTAVETQPRWAPDGSRILFLTGGGVSIAPVLGGSSQPIIPSGAASVVTSATWSPDGRSIGFIRGDSLLRVPLEGGMPALIGTGQDLHSCSWSPNGALIACVTFNAEAVLPSTSFGNLAPSGIVLFPAAGGAPVRIAEPTVVNQSPVWHPDGSRLLFISNRDGPRDIYALRVSKSGHPNGAPERLTTGLGAMSISLSGSGGTLVYDVYSARSNIWALPYTVGPPAAPSRATALTRGSQVIEGVRVSRDGRWLVYDSNLRGNSDIYRLPIEGGAIEQLTDDPADEFAGDLSPDNRAVAYHSWRSHTRDIEVKPLAGGTVVHVTDSPAQESYPRWSPDGSALVFYDQGTPHRVFTVKRLGPGRWSEPSLFASPGNHAAWSPDGREIAYIPTESTVIPGPVVVQPVAGGPARRLFSPGGGIPPAEEVIWSPGGSHLLYKSHDALGRASFWEVDRNGGTPRLLARLDDPGFQSHRKDFAANDTQLFFPVEDRQSDVFVAELGTR